MTEPKHWEWYRTRDGYKRHIDKIVSWFSDKQGSVIDAGCGDGLLASKLLQANPALLVVGIDVDKAVIAEGKDNVSNASFFVGDIFELSVSPADYLVSSEMIEHVARPLEEMIAKLAALCKYGLYLTTPDGTHSCGNPQHVREYKTGEVVLLLQRFFLDVSFFKHGDSVHYVATGKV